MFPATIRDIDQLDDLLSEPTPAVLDTLRELLARPGVERVKLVANLPYAVAVPVIANRS